MLMFELMVTATITPTPTAMPTLKRWRCDMLAMLRWQAGSWPTKSARAELAIAVGSDQFTRPGYALMH